MGAEKEREDIRRKLKSIAQVDDSLVVAEVLAVDFEKKTCDVKPLGHAEIFDVRLKAAIDDLAQYVIEVPVVGSSVIVGQMKTAAVVVKCNEVAQYSYHISEEHRYSISSEGLKYVQGDVLFNVSESGVNIQKGDAIISLTENGSRLEKGGIDLLSVFKDLIAAQSDVIAELSKVVVALGVTPNVAALTVIDQKLNGDITNNVNEVLN